MSPDRRNAVMVIIVVGLIMAQDSVYVYSSGGVYFVDQSVETHSIRAEHTDYEVFLPPTRVKTVPGRRVD